MSDLNNQTQILLNLKKHHSDKYSLDYYDINELPKDMADAYWKDHMIAARPLIVGTMSVYTWDFEAWRRRYLVALGVEQPAVICALFELVRRHSSDLQADCYDIGKLPQDLSEAYRSSHDDGYWKDHNESVFGCGTWVDAHDFEQWRNQYFAQLTGVENKKQEQL